MKIYQSSFRCYGRCSKDNYPIPNNTKQYNIKALPFLAGKNTEIPL